MKAQKTQVLVQSSVKTDSLTKVDPKAFAKQEFQRLRERKLSIPMKLFHL